MGGKSTFLRQNALIAILAQAGTHIIPRILFRSDLCCLIQYEIIQDNKLMLNIN
jgi:hypothetical protein